MTRGSVSGHHLLAGTTPPTGMGTLGSTSSIDSMSMGNISGGQLTPSPSTTPPKKTWERNYKSFLKKSLKHHHHHHGSSPSGASAAALVASSLLHRPLNTLPLKPMPRFQRTASDYHSHVNQQWSQSQLPLHQDESQHEDLGPSLADGFQDHSQHKHTHSLDFSTGRRKIGSNNSKVSLTAPPSPKDKESSTKGGTFFKRLRSKTKSHDSLDSTIRRGVDRKSPNNTPPGSVDSTPRRSPTTLGTGVMTQQQGEEKAAALHEHLQAPMLETSNSSGSRFRLLSDASPSIVGVLSQGDLYNDSLDQPMHHGHATTSTSSGDLANNDNLDKPMHNGHTVSTSSLNNDTLDKPMHNGNKVSISSLNLPDKSAMISRVQSMGCTLPIREGEPGFTANEEEQLIRERKKAFTDFHNMGIDSSSAFLGGEDSSVHSSSVFLSSMAYPVGSAGSKGEIMLVLRCVLSC